MTTNQEPRESRMLELVRRWRRESYEAEPKSEAERQKREDELLRRFNVKAAPEHPPKRRAAG